MDRCPTILHPCYQPSPRWCSFTSPVEGKLYVFGGRTKDFTKEKKELASVVDVFDPNLKVWSEIKTTGFPPTGLYLGASASSGHHLYTYGGKDEQNFYGSLHQLDTRTMMWKQLSAHSAAGPIRKLGAGMVIHGEKLILFGGYGDASDPIQPGSEIIKDGDTGKGWTNELHIFDIIKGKWSSPKISGTRPTPCAFFSLTMIDDHRAVLFGGKIPTKRTNDVYIIDLSTMHWSRLAQHMGEPCPVGRMTHAAVHLDYGKDRSQLLIIEGIDNDNNVLSDVWMLDLQSWKWKEVKCPNLQSREGHCAATFGIRPGQIEVVIFGGCPKWKKHPKTEADYPQIADTTLLIFNTESKM